MCKEKACKGYRSQAGVSPLLKRNPQKPLCKWFQNKRNLMVFCINSLFHSYLSDVGYFSIGDELAYVDTGG